MGFESRFVPLSVQETLIDRCASLQICFSLIHENAAGDESASLPLWTASCGLNIVFCQSFLPCRNAYPLNSSCFWFSLTDLVEVDQGEEHFQIVIVFFDDSATQVELRPSRPRTYEDVNIAETINRILQTKSNRWQYPLLCSDVGWRVLDLQDHGSPLDANLLS